MASTSEDMSQTQGPVLLGMAFAVGLYGITCAQTFWYYQVYADGDAKWLKVLSGLLWLFNTIHTAVVIHIPYFYLITASYDSGLRDETAWSLPASSIVLAFVSSMVYVFYIRRLWLLSKGNIIICGLLAILAVGHFVTTFTFGILGLVTDKNMKEYMSHPSSTFLLVATCFGTSTDLLSALATCWCLSRSRTGYKDTDSTINVIMTYTINTGLVAAMCVLCSLISLVAWPESYLTILFLFLIAPLETNSYLGSLNARDYFHRHGQRRGNAVGLPNFHPGSVQPVEIRVNRTLETYQLKTSHTTEDKSNLSVGLGTRQSDVVDNNESNGLSKSQITDLELEV